MTSLATLLLSACLVVTNLGFTVAYDPDTRTPAWIAYTLTPDRLRPHAPRLPLPFTADPRFPDACPDLNPAYLHSGYDRGHLAPAADFNYDTNHLVQTYHFSNIAPQLPAVNRDTWLAAERAVRAICATTSNPVHVVTFPYFATTPPVTTNTLHAAPSPDTPTNAPLPSVRIPDAFVKLAYGTFGTRLWFVPNRPFPHNQPLALDALIPPLPPLTTPPTPAPFPTNAPPTPAVLP